MRAQLKFYSELAQVAFACLASPRESRDQIFEQSVMRGDAVAMKRMGLLGARYNPSAALEELLRQPVNYRYQLSFGRRQGPMPQELQAFRQKREKGFAAAAAYLARRVDLVHERDALGDSWMTRAFNGQSALSWLNRPLHLQARAQVVVEALHQGCRSGEPLRGPDLHAIFAEEADPKRRAFLAQTVRRLHSLALRTWQQDPAMPLSTWHPASERLALAALQGGAASSIRPEAYPVPTREFTDYMDGHKRTNEQDLHMRRRNREALGLAAQ